MNKKKFSMFYVEHRIRIAVATKRNIPMLK